jgi:hypothetical protein
VIREEWKRIWEFPQYSVSNYGRIRDEHRDRLMATSQTTHGHVKISLRDRHTGERYTRSVALLVAQNFVERPDALSDAVIVLDGKPENVVAWNLAWRPAWFAWHYAHQFRCQQPIAFQNLRVRNITRGYVYRSVIEAGVNEGLLFDDIWRSCCTPSENRPRIYPHRCQYEVAERV